ncbi:hypothetical protein MACH17_14210 [Phaeobacter inhibens]|nr:hypothetical protein MACH17_14210 [Phaeobacter inhibens]
MTGGAALVWRATGAVCGTLRLDGAVVVAGWVRDPRGLRPTVIFWMDYPWSPAGREMGISEKQWVSWLIGGGFVFFHGNRRKCQNTA